MGLRRGLGSVRSSCRGMRNANTICISPKFFHALKLFTDITDIVVFLIHYIRYCTSFEPRRAYDTNTRK